MIIERRTWIPATLGVAATLVALGGCVKNEEKITVHEDGSVDLQMVVDGDREDMENGAPAMAKRDGWVFTQHMVTKDDGKQEVHRQAEISIPAGKPIPAAYPTDDAEGQALALQHPTTLTMERRSDATYYHFRRTYEPRKAAFVNVWWNDFFEKFGDADPAEMGAEKVREFVDNLGDVAQYKQTAIVRAAELALDDPWPQDLRLAAYDAIRRVIHSVDPDEVVEMLTAADDKDDSDAKLDALAERVDDEVVEAITTVLQSARISAHDIRAFQRVLARERRRYAITDDYMDDLWQVKLQMPGTLVGHNGEKIEDGAIVWERKGEYFYDRTVELLATSKVQSNRGR